jgi:hypothetical protein
MTVVELLKLLVDLKQLLTDRLARLDAREGHQHGFHLNLAVDQDAALAGAGFVGHCRSNGTFVLQLGSPLTTVASVTAVMANTTSWPTQLGRWWTVARR